MSETQLSIEERVKKEIAFYGCIPVEEVKSGQHIYHDLGFDSLDAVECVIALEDEFGIEISDEDADKLYKVEDIIDYVAAKAGP